jgi:hypothetical protein
MATSNNHLVQNLAYLRQKYALALCQINRTINHTKLSTDEDVCNFAKDILRTCTEDPAYHHLEPLARRTKNAVMMYTRDAELVKPTLDSIARFERLYGDREGWKEVFQCDQMQQLHTLYARDRLAAIGKLERLWKEYAIVAGRERVESKAKRKAAPAAEKHV